jgi:hypothetical protein
MLLLSYSLSRNETSGETGGNLKNSSTIATGFISRKNIKIKNDMPNNYLRKLANTASTAQQLNITRSKFIKS